MGTHKYHSERLRKRRFLTLRVQRRPISRREVVLLASVAFVLVAVVSICIVILHRQQDTPVATAELLRSAADVRLPAKQFDDGQARFYRYITRGSREVRFFVIKTPDGIVHAAFDSCELCYRQRRGYRQVGKTMVCHSCRRVFPLSSIGVFKGDCNPSPVEGTVESAQVVVKALTLELGAAYF